MASLNARFGQSPKFPKLFGFVYLTVLGRVVGGEDLGFHLHISNPQGQLGQEGVTLCLRRKLAPSPSLPGSSEQADFLSAHYYLPRAEDTVDVEQISADLKMQRAGTCPHDSREPVWPGLCSHCPEFLGKKGESKSLHLSVTDGAMLTQPQVKAQLKTLPGPRTLARCQVPRRHSECAGKR